EITRPSMGSEDFSYYLQKVKGSFFRLGTGKSEKGAAEYWHSSRYDVDESALSVGAGFMAYLAYCYLNLADSSN
ncbi:amidohydrolase, partial [candidate division KSB1 bacterium]